MSTPQERSRLGRPTGNWFDLARRPSVVRRACRYAVGVGAPLITINHGDAVLRRDVSGTRLLRMVLTLMVPYGVSSASSVSALRESGG